MKLILHLIAFLDFSWFPYLESSLKSIICWILKTKFQDSADSPYCDLDDYLKQELEKLQQEPGKEFLEQNRDNRTDRASCGEAIVTSDSTGDIKQKVKTNNIWDV